MTESLFGGAVWTLVTLIVLLILFIIFREVVCWYWKINRTVALLEEIRDRLPPPPPPPGQKSVSGSG